MEMALMKTIRKVAAAGMILTLALLMAGCGTTGNTTLQSSTNQSALSGTGAASLASSDRFNVGDLVVVSFSGLTDPPAPHEERIKEDGTITLMLIGQVTAKGKTPGELQKEIRQTYVDKRFFTETLTITVKVQERFFFVGGQVRSPNRYIYAEGMTVLKAIQSAGDFNEFAKRTKVQVTRLDGRTIIVNCKKALDNPKYDIPIYPGDRINVPRSL
jgi:polysaccharide export outer membrane protein